MDAISILFLLFSICVALYWILPKNLNYWKNQNIATLPTYPILGSYAECMLMKTHLALKLDEYYKKYPNEKVVGGFNCTVPDLLVRDLDYIKHILIKDSQHFDNRGYNIDEAKEPLTRHLFFAAGNTWKTLRYKLTPTFTTGKIKKMFPLIQECGEELLYCINEASEQELEASSIMAKYTTDVIGSCAFGIKMQTLKEDDSPFRSMGTKIFEFTPAKTLSLILLYVAPKLFYYLGYKLIDADVEMFFINVVKDIITERQSKELRHDFVDLLIQLKSEGSCDGVQFTDELLTAQAFSFFAAGFETSSTTMGFCLHELAQNFKVQEKVIAEIMRVLKEFDGKLCYEAIKKMPYLEMVLNETLRMHPPGAFIIRKCTTKYCLPDGGPQLKVGDSVSIPVYALHHDPQYYPNPHIFLPERFGYEEIAKRPSMAYLPFGTGQRACIGMRFARMEIMIGLVMILRSYSVEPSSKSKKDIEYNQTGLILNSKNGIWINFKPRICHFKLRTWIISTFISKQFCSRYSWVQFSPPEKRDALNHAHS